MERSRECAELRREISRRRARSRFAPELVERIQAHVAARRVEGATWQSLADELGIALDTLFRWERERRTGLRRVEVIVDRHELVVRGPCGIRVEGLDVDAVADLVRKLA